MDLSFNFRTIEQLTDDDPEFRKELMDSYLSSFRKFPNEFAELLGRRDIDELRFAIHRIKASVRMVEADELDRLLEAAPRLATNGTDAEIEQSSARVAQICQALVTKMQIVFA